MLRERKVDDGADHAKLQLARLERVMRLAGEAIAKGELRAASLYLKALNRLDRYQKVAGAIQHDDDEARERLLTKLNEVAERLGYDKILAENKRILAEHEAREKQSLAGPAAGAPRQEPASNHA